MESIIGKQYKPYDNSYSFNVTEIAGHHTKTPTRHYLAGNYMGESTKICTIISEPFECIIEFHGKKESLTMVMVNYENNTHMVMFHPNNVI